MVSYEYEAWGKVLSITGSMSSTVGQKNPYRYRRYRYDNETGFYYLQSIFGAAAGLFGGAGAKNMASKTFSTVTRVGTYPSIVYSAPSRNALKAIMSNEFKKTAVKTGITSAFNIISNKKKK